MRWRVEIRNFAGHRRLLDDVLRELSMAVVEVNGDHFLTGEAFETWATPTEVHSYASKIQAIVHQVCGRDPPIDLGFSLGQVVHEATDGNLEQRHHLLAIHAAIHAHDAADVILATATTGEGVSEGERKRLEAERAEHEYQQIRVTAVTRVVTAVIDDRAFTVQRLLSGELLPQSLGHVAELIEADQGERANDLATKNQWSRFYRSINHPAVFGESARHIVSNTEPPPNPMTLNEARLFIRNVAEKWLTAKAESRGNV